MWIEDGDVEPWAPVDEPVPVEEPLAVVPVEEPLAVVPVDEAPPFAEAALLEVLPLPVEEPQPPRARITHTSPPAAAAALIASDASGAPRSAGEEHLHSPLSAMTPHFLTGAELTAAELEELLARAEELKREPLRSSALEGRSVALIFQKPSTRTRLSFEVGVHELGGQPLILRSDEMQLSRGEALRDTALVLGRHVAAVGLRTGSEATLQELALHSPVPVFNMLSPEHHPCQALADLLTLREAYGTLAGLRIAYVGDGNNVARSLAMLGTLAGLHVAIASPPGYALEDELSLSPEASGTVTLYEDPREAVKGAQAVYTDVWVSMGDELQADERRRALAAYTLDDELLDAAAEGAFAMHDLPAHAGEEISAEVLYGERQRIWEQAENRRHAQKALLELLLARRQSTVAPAGGSS